MMVIEFDDDIDLSVDTLLVQYGAYFDLSNHTAPTDSIIESIFQDLETEGEEPLFNLFTVFLNNSFALTTTKSYFKYEDKDVYIAHAGNVPISNLVTYIASGMKNMADFSFVEFVRLFAATLSTFVIMAENFIDNSQPKTRVYLAAGDAAIANILTEEWAQFLPDFGEIIGGELNFDIGNIKTLVSSLKVIKGGANK